MDKSKQEKRLSELIMPPPPNPTPSKPKNKKPKPVEPIKKKKKNSQQFKEPIFPPIAENPVKAREELPRGVTYEDFIKWGDLKTDDLRQFCEKAANKNELDKAVETLDALISKNEKKASKYKSRANLEMDFFFRKCRAIEKKERSLSRLTSQLCDMEGAVDAFEDIQQFLVQADASAKILIDTVKGSVKVEAERVAKIRENGLKAMQDKTAMLEDYLAYEKIKRGILHTRKTMSRNETIVWLIEKGREPKTPATEKSGGKKGIEEQEDEDEIAEFPSTEKSDDLMSPPSQDSNHPVSDHELSQFSDA